MGRESIDIKKLQEVINSVTKEGVIKKVGDYAKDIIYEGKDESGNKIFHIKVSNLKISGVKTIKKNDKDERSTDSLMIKLPGKNKDDNSPPRKITFCNVCFVPEEEYNGDKEKCELELDLSSCNIIDFKYACAPAVDLSLKCCPEEGSAESNDARDKKSSQVIIENCCFHNLTVNYTPEGNKASSRFESEDSDYKNLTIKLGEYRNANSSKSRSIMGCGRNCICKKYHKCHTLSEFHNYCESKNNKGKMEYDNQEIFVSLKRNTIEKMAFNLLSSNNDSNRYIAKIVRGNDIKLLRVYNEYPDVLAWGLYEKVGFTTREYPGATCRDLKTDKDAEQFQYRRLDENKKVLRDLKRLAVEKHDRVQEATIGKHIAECDEQLIYLEPPHFWQEKVIMWLGRKLSYHGSSWIRPLLWLTAANGLVAWWLLILLSSCNNGSNSYARILLELFNPVSRLSYIFAEDNFTCIDYLPLFIVILVVVTKAFYAICVYEVVRAARKYTIR